MATTTDGTANGIDALDLTTRVRRRVLPALHRVKEPLGGYAICRQHPSEFVGTLERDLDAVRSLLVELDFEREPIASLKIRDDGRRSAGSWVRRDSPLATRQLHVTLFRAESGAIEVFAHREYSWLRHPYKHYTQDGWDSRGGVERMRALLSARNVSYRRDGSATTAAD
ncbi:hypothetical protein A6E15_12720 [Natrinema saccharevitans]|uniref:Uncharacterized protein n=1 Tax=Natrinema saccharevitans TaxID=301967 RepID=A0A1S8AYK1_9EURY|nr:hypothetical protein [Natrinema saccharevitans]OLZ41795.1 hypothetical protein A6E15_12720 [Natrinema saccharevitans]